MVGMITGRGFTIRSGAGGISLSKTSFSLVIFVKI